MEDSEKQLPISISVLNMLQRLCFLALGAETHKVVARLLSYHFVKPGLIPLQIVIYLENLYERRKIAEYSSKAGWEFTPEHVRTYKTLGPLGYNTTT